MENFWKFTKITQKKENSILYSLLKEKDKQDLVWITDKEVLNANKVKSIVSNLRKYHHKEKESRIAICIKNPLNLATMLIYGESFCETTLLLEPQLDEKLILNFCKKSKCKTLFSDVENILNSIRLNKNLKIKKINNLVKLNENNYSFEELSNCNSSILTLTSGTSGKPKLMEHNFDTLTRTIRKNQKPNKLKWGLLYGLTKFAGLQVFLQSFITSSELFLLDLSKPLDENISILKKNECNALSATPTMFRKLLMHSNFSKLKLDQITLGGEIVDQKILDSLRKLFPKAKITHLYASTEAGVGFSVKDGLEGFPKEFLFNKNSSYVLKMSSKGNLLIKNLNISDKRYLKSNEGNLNIDSKGFLDTGDKIKIQNERCIFLGRENGTINVGGNKVQPEEIERVILENPDVIAVSVRGKKSSMTGEIVLATITIKNMNVKNEIKKSIIRDFKSKKIESYKIPGIFKFNTEFKTNESGKLVRS